MREFYFNANVGKCQTFYRSGSHSCARPGVSSRSSNSGSTHGVSDRSHTATPTPGAKDRSQHTWSMHVVKTSHEVKLIKSAAARFYITPTYLPLRRACAVNSSAAHGDNIIHLKWAKLNPGGDAFTYRTLCGVNAAERVT